MPKVDPRHFITSPQATALLIVDMQNDFVLPGAELSTPHAVDIIPSIVTLADACRTNGFPVIYTQEEHRPGLEDFGIEGSFESPHCLEGTPGGAIVNGLQPKEQDYIIAPKRRYDAFFGTELDLLLRCLKVENLLFAGVCTDICVISTVYHARNLDYRCYVVEDAVDGTSVERHEAALLCMSHVWAMTGTSRQAAEIFDLPLGKGPEDSLVHQVSIRQGQHR